jgi:ribosomal protein S18 acetylase RimI-like enzyme
MNIRPASHPQDLPAIQKLANLFNVFGDYVPVFIQMLAKDPNLVAYGVRPANVELFIAEDAGLNPVGFVAVEWKPETHTAELHGIAVDQNQARQGFASALLQYVLEHAKNHRVTRMNAKTAETANPKAMSFFEQHGFSRGRFAGHYPQRQRAIWLNLDLDNAA